MQGESYRDSEGNSIRLLDVVRGPNFYVYIGTLEMDHESYFNTVLPTILTKLVKLFEAIRFLHFHGFRHGDIRNDHVIIEDNTGNFVWIDFDYDYESVENPFSLDIMGIGNILLYAVGKGFHNLKQKKRGKQIYNEILSIVEPEDFSILHKWRFMNLKKLFPYIPIGLNDILAHFTLGSDVFYESVDEIIADLKTCIYSGFS